MYLLPSRITFGAKNKNPAQRTHPGGDRQDCLRALKQKPFDEQQWQKLYYRHQQCYLRQRLEAIRLLHHGNTRAQVCQQLNLPTIPSADGSTNTWRGD